MNRRSAIRHALMSTGAITLGLRSSPFDITPSEWWSSPVRDEAYWLSIREQFRFQEGLLYFNNASLGGSPTPVIEATNTFRRQLDAYPSKYMWGGWSEEKSVVREKMAAMINADPDEVALVHNTTEGMNLIASSMDLDKGDEIILGNHEHPTARIPWQYYQEQGRGVKLVRPELPLTPTDPEELIEVYRAAITKRTRVISLVHMTNTNGMILPVRQICAMARERGILTAVDGAQSLASVPCDMQDLGCDYFAASAHKWLFSPKGMGVLFARSDAPPIKPLIANRRYKSKTMIRVEDYNTRNLPELLGMGAAIDFHNSVGPEAIHSRMAELREYFDDQLTQIPGVINRTPPRSSLAHQIVAVEKEGISATDLKKALYDDHGIDVRWMGSHGMNGVRISLAIYHSLDDVDRLIAGLAAAE